MDTSKRIACTILVFLAFTLYPGHAASNCTEKEAETQATAFFENYCRDCTTNWRKQTWSACGAKKWLTQLHELLRPGDRHIIDIGCNKGYESGIFFDLLVPEAKLSPQSMFDLHSTANHHLTGSLCGVCNNCNETVDRGANQDTSRHKSVHVYCFEPSVRNFLALMNVEARFADVLAKHNTKWHLYNSAVSNFTGVMEFRRDCASTQCSFHSEAFAADSKELDMAFVVSIDDFVSVQKLAHIDVLKIDTEGHDPVVLYGAAQVLKYHMVEVLYFEYHYLGLWQDVTLKSVVEWLDAFEYVCYLEGTPTLTRLSGCWHDWYEFKNWSNVVCVYQGSDLYKEMEKITFLATAATQDGH